MKKFIFGRSFSDLRSKKRAKKIMKSMMKTGSSVIQRFSKNRAEIVANSRFFNNDMSSTAKLINAITIRCGRQVKGKHVLAIQDTTEFNFTSHKNYLNLSECELGPITNEECIGYFLHPTLILDAKTTMSLGFSDVQIWNRTFNAPSRHERNYRHQPIEEKESYRWIEAAMTTKQRLSQANQITIIADREADIYEEFIIVPDSKTHLLIRSNHDRPLYEQQENLRSYIGRQQNAGRYKIMLKTTDKRTKRTAYIEVRFSRVKIKRPKVSKPDMPAYIELNVVEAREYGKKVKDKSVHWILLTTHRVENYTDALQIIQWYGKRWEIELLFGILKTKGLDVESSQLENGKALKKMTVMSLAVALQIHQLKQGREHQEPLSAVIVFSEEQISVLYVMLKQYEGKTKKQKNPWKKETLAWAAWIVARMGGWMGYTSESPPGTKTFHRGLIKLNDFAKAISAMKMATNSQKICA